jgi:hypothetical protein
MKNNVVTIASGTVYDVEVSGAEVVVELLGGTMAMGLLSTLEREF